MPTVLRVGPYSFGFFSADRTEPPHVHVTRDRCEAKFWIDPLVEFESNVGFASHELRTISQLVAEHRDYFLEQWHERFGQ